MAVARGLSIYENFIESIAQVLSKALTDKETERLLSSFVALQQRLRQLSVENLRRLEAKTQARRSVCKHQGSCSVNALRALVRSFAITYALKYVLNLVPALITRKVFTKPRFLIKIGGRDTISFALFMSFFISSYKAVLCSLRAIRGKNDPWNAFGAGCLAGLSIFLDKNRSRRIMIALYLSTRTGQFVSRWIWRNWLSKYIDKRGSTSSVHGHHNQNKTLHLQHRQTDRIGSATYPRFMIGNGRGSGSESNLYSEDVSSSIAASPIRGTKSVVSPTSMSDRGSPSLRSPYSATREFDASSPFPSPARLASTELAHLEDVDDHHHTHHPMRKWIRQASAVIVMMLSSSQILGAYIVEPDTLARPYLSFLITHGGMRQLQPKKPREYLEAMGSTIRRLPYITPGIFTHTPSPSPSITGEEERIADFLASLPTGVNIDRLTKFASSLVKASHDYVLCAFQHPTTSSCAVGFWHAMYYEWFRAVSLYAPLNAIMTIVFRGKRVLSHPLRSIVNYAFSTARSSLFLTSYVATAWSMPCLLRHIFGYDALWMYYVNGLAAGATVLIEVPGRRLELALYCLPRAIESFWNSLVRRGYAKHIPAGEVIYFCLSTGVLMTLYQSDPGSIHEGYRKIMYRFFGVN